jgi:hemerythrin
MATLQRKFLTTSQAAKLLQVSVATLKRWASAGLIASERTSGGHRRFKEADLRIMISPGGEGPLARWADALLGAETPLAAQNELFQMKLEAGSWVAFADSLHPLVMEFHRRREGGALTTVQWLDVFDRVRRALLRFLDHVSHVSDAPRLLLASVPGDRILLSTTLLELTACEARWKPRLAGSVAPSDLATELRREAAEAVIATASLDSDPRLIGRYANEVASVAEAMRTPLAVLGSGAWPEPLPGGLRLRTYQDVRAWLDKLASGARRGPPPAEAPPHEVGRSRQDERVAMEGDRLTWTAVLSIGDPMVDDQHRLLFQHGRRFVRAVGNGDSNPRLRQMLRFLQDYAEVHFRAEENLMRAAGYPDWEPHTREHEQFTQRLRLIAPRLETEGDSGPLRGEVASFVRSWLTEHVSSSDQRLAQHLRGRSGRDHP